MGKILDFGFKPEHSQLLSARVHMAPAAATAQSTASVSADPSESRVSHAMVKDPTAATRRARWRKKNPEQHAIQQRAARARRKAVAS